MKFIRAYGVGLILSILVVLLSACGGGGGGDETSVPTSTIITAGLSGPSTNIGAIDLEITLPANFTLAVDGQGNPSTLQLVPRLTDTNLAVNYVHPILKVTAIRATGFLPGDLITLSRTLTTGETVPTSGNFTITFQAYDLEGTAFGTGSFTATLLATGQ